MRHDRSNLVSGAIEQLRELVRRQSGRSLTYLRLSLESGREGVFLLGDEFRVAASEQFVAESKVALELETIEVR